MLLKELRAILIDISDSANIDFRNPNFGGVLRQLDRQDIEVSKDKMLVLIDPPLWESVDDI